MEVVVIWCPYLPRDQNNPEIGEKCTISNKPCYEDTNGKLTTPSGLPDITSCIDYKNLATRHGITITYHMRVAM